ncbi:hypothetical protein ACFLQR_03700 [Verrucomicrobiota bacterium]
MKSFHKIITIAVLVMLVLNSAYGEKTRNVRKEQEKRKEKILQKVVPFKDMTFEKKNSDVDLLRGFVTYSLPSQEDGSREYVAYVYLNWGDLDKKIPVRKENYQNWDGYVKIREAGRAEVVKEFRFDDGSLGRDSSKKNAKDLPQPCKGSGRDKLLKDEISSQVVWQSGIVGDTDGLLIRLDLHKPFAKGTIKAGNFTIPFIIRPRSED